MRDHLASLQNTLENLKKLHTEIGELVSQYETSDEIQMKMLNEMHNFVKFKQEVQTQNDEAIHAAYARDTSSDDPKVGESPFSPIRKGKLFERVEERVERAKSANKAKREQRFSDLHSTPTQSFTASTRVGAQIRDNLRKTSRT